MKIVSALLCLLVSSAALAAAKPLSDDEVASLTRLLECKQTAKDIANFDKVLTSRLPKLTKGKEVDSKQVEGGFTYVADRPLTANGVTSKYIYSSTNNVFLLVPSAQPAKAMQDEAARLKLPADPAADKEYPTYAQPVATKTTWPNGKPLDTKLVVFPGDSGVSVSKYYLTGCQF